MTEQKEPLALTDRTAIVALLRAAYEERRDALGWLGKSGQLTKRGADDAMSWFVGAYVALKAVGGPDLGGMVFLASVRTVEDALQVD